MLRNICITETVIATCFLRCSTQPAPGSALPATAVNAAAPAKAAGVAASAAGGTGVAYSQQDAVFARNVGQAVVDWILERLSDYHSK